jgi:hypothetical protein
VKLHYVKCKLKIYSRLTTIILAPPNIIQKYFKDGLCNMVTVQSKLSGLSWKSEWVFQLIPFFCTLQGYWPLSTILQLKFNPLVLIKIHSKRDRQTEEMDFGIRQTGKGFNCISKFPSHVTLNKILNFSKLIFFGTEWRW